MCGRVFVKSSFSELMASFAAVRRSNLPGLDTGPRHNGAPSLVYPIIVADGDSINGAWAEARWGLVPPWTREAKPKIAPINARCETVRSNGLFRGAYRSRRCLIPVHGYFEWTAIKGAKQPYALAMRSGEPFCLGAVWESRRDGERVEQRTFAVVTVPANSLVAGIHDRMPLVLHAWDYARWLSDDPDPGDLMVPYPSEAMVMWPVSRRVNKAGVEGADLLDPIELGEGE